MTPRAMRARLETLSCARPAHHHKETTMHPHRSHWITARGLSLIAIVIGGLMFAFGEGGSKKALAGIIFGLGMAMGAANFLTWLFS